MTASEIIVAVCKTSFQKSKPKKILYRNYKNFDINIFKKVLRLKPQSIKSYESFEQVFLEVFNEHAPLKKKFFRANHVPYMTKSLRKATMRHPELERLKVSILKIGPLKIKLNKRNKIIFVVNFIKRNGKNSTQTIKSNNRYTLFFL